MHLYVVRDSNGFELGDEEDGGDGDDGVADVEDDDGDGGFE